MDVIELISANGAVIEIVGLSNVVEVIEQPITFEISSGAPGPAGAGLPGPPGAPGAPGYTQTAYPLTITSDGQTVFNLPVPVTDVAKTGVFVNGIKQRLGADWTAGGTVMTWLSPDLTLAITDTLEILI